MAQHTFVTPFQPIFELTRGETVESSHYGALAVVDSHGRLMASVGTSQATSFLRSSAKPLQALAFIEAGGHKKYAFSKKEIALLCASHSGTEEHFQVLTGIQTRVQVTEADLLCGVHLPTDEPTRQAMISRGESPTPNRHNCSGKHTGMLAMARLIKAPIENYIDFDHPIQIRILNTFSEMVDLPIPEIALGIDGCSAPVFAVPLYHAAYGYARFCDPFALPAKRAVACRILTQSMMAAPEMVAGPGKFDTRLMQVCKGKIISKGGAEGYQQIGIMPGVLEEHSPGIGIALKISDGDARSRARPAVILEVLHQLGAIKDNEMVQLAEFGPKIAVLNWRKLHVGDGYPILSLPLKP